MKTKERDIIYCGVDKNKIKNSSPILNGESLKLLEKWIIERYKVHLNKDVLKLSKPWTEYKPLLEYKFTNVKRYHDKQTLALIDNIVRNDDFTLREKIINCILFRTWNKWETIYKLGGPWFEMDFIDPIFRIGIRKKIEVFQDIEPDYIWFSNAFNTGSMKNVWGWKGAKNSFKSKGVKTIKLRKRDV